MKFLLLFLFTFCFALQTEKPCKLRKLAHGFVCVCSETYCDTLNLSNITINADEFLLISSSESGLRFDIKQEKISSAPEENENSNSSENLNVEINQDEKYQKIIGFGGSFTGTVAYLLNKLPESLRESFYKSYYTSDFGAGYTLMRSPIGGCDFDLEPWAYNEYPEGDEQLTNFTEPHPNDKRRFELIKEMLNVTNNWNVKIIAAAWSPPLWMKANHSWYGQRHNQLKPEYYQTWADYHVKYLDLMNAINIPIWAISTGNEPDFAPNLGFISMSWNASNHGRWLVEHLAPSLRNSKHSNIEIHAFDDNRNTLLAWIHNFTSTNPNALEFVSGFNIHGYFDFNTSATILDLIAKEYPGKSILYTEMCFGAEIPISDVGVKHGSWIYAEEMIQAILPNLLHNLNGYIDWNLLLDSNGGPNYANNVLDAPIIVNENFTELYKQPMYYVMAHFSKFILPDSYRIEAKVNGLHSESVDVVSFLRPDDKIAIIIYNRNTEITISVNVIDKCKGLIRIDLEPKSLNTLIYSK